jgi:hypothetical protein
MDHQMFLIFPAETRFPPALRLLPESTRCGGLVCVRRPTPYFFQHVCHSVSSVSIRDPRVSLKPMLTLANNTAGSIMYTTIDQVAPFAVLPGVPDFNAIPFASFSNFVTCPLTDNGQSGNQKVYVSYFHRSACDVPWQ